MGSKCIFCEKQISAIDGLHRIECIDCGNYQLENMENTDVMNFVYSLQGNREKIKKNIHNIRGYLKEHELFTITKDNLEYIINLKDLRVNEKLKKLFKFLYEKMDVGEKFSTMRDNNILKLVVSEKPVDDNLISVIYGKNEAEVNALIKQLVEQGYIQGAQSAQDNNYYITAKGFEYIEKSENTVSDMGFVAMWFNQSMDNAWNESIYKAVYDAGYLPKRIDIHDHNNVILEEIEGLIRQSKFVVADLTGHRGGVYFEAGLAKALQKPVIYTCETDDFDERHFDIKHFNCLKWDKTNLANFKDDLQKRIENTLGKGNFYK